MKVNTNIHINRPPADLFSFISNFTNNPKWQGGMVEAWYTTDPPLRTGSTWSQVVRFLGRRIESTFEVIEYQPGRLIKATTIKSLFPITVTRIVEPENDGSRMTAIVEGDVPGLFKLAEPLLTKQIKKRVERDFQNLQRILEH